MQLRECAKCRTKRPLSDFHSKKTENRYHSWCKECVYSGQRRRWIDRKIRAVKLFGNKCSKCGYDTNIGALNFHHLDPSQKECNWSKLRLRAWHKIVKELKKCTLLCSNCHAEEHYPQLDKEAILGDSAANKRLDHEFKEIACTGVCPHCSQRVYGTKYCSVECVSMDKRKVQRPTKSVLRKHLKTESFCSVGRKYGVSDNTVRKWAKQYELI